MAPLLFNLVFPSYLASSLSPSFCQSVCLLGLLSFPLPTLSVCFRIISAAFWSFFLPADYFLLLLLLLIISDLINLI